MLFESQQEKGERLRREALRSYEIAYDCGQFRLFHGSAVWFTIAEKADPPTTITLDQARSILENIIESYKPYKEWKEKSLSQEKSGDQ